MNLRVCLLAAMLIAPFSSAAPANAGEPESCQSVRMAQPGWNDLLLTHSVASVLLEGLGYETESSLLGLNIIFRSLETAELDVFLGFWDPAMVNEFGQFRDNGTVETVAVNLTGAKYTYAVPEYAWEAGVKDVRDLHKFADKFGSRLYGIEPGSNQIFFDLIADPEFMLDGWEVVESSEQGMLSQVDRAVRRGEWVVFQGWAPHPMNTKFNIRYLTGADDYFGPDFGAATVSTVVRKGYQTQCPNVTRLLGNLVFDIDMENRGIGYITEDDMDPDAAARKLIVENADRLPDWLSEVTAFDGTSGLAAIKAGLGL